MLKHIKFFYFIKLKSIILNNKFIIFIKNNHKSNKFITLKLSLILSIFNKTNLISFINNNYYMLFFNDKSLFLKNNFKIMNIYAFSYSGFFINNNFLKKIKNYYLFYTNNFNIFIILIYNFIINYKYMYYYIYIKLLVLLITKIKYINI